MITLAYTTSISHPKIEAESKQDELVAQESRASPEACPLSSSVYLFKSVSPTSKACTRAMCSVQCFLKIALKIFFWLDFHFNALRKQIFLKVYFLKYSSQVYGLEKTAVIHNISRYCHIGVVFGKIWKNSVYTKYYANKNHILLHNGKSNPFCSRRKSLRSEPLTILSDSFIFFLS